MSVVIKEIHASQLARPMSCAGFLHFEDLPKPDTSEAAEEGTAAAELLERLLKKQPIVGQATNGVYFNDEMHFFIRPIAELIQRSAHGEVFAEQRVDWQTRSGIWVRGRYDVSFDAENILYIDDLKYGWGIVEAPKNWQLLAYAIGEVIRRKTAFPKIRLRIHQPRPHHEDGPTRVWEITYAELLEYKEQIESRLEMIQHGHNDLQTGKHCKYCPAAGESCPAFNKLFYRGLEVSHQFVQDQINEEELARQLDHASRAAEVIKIKLDSLTELAVNRIKGGKVIPGYLTETRLGDRKWKDGISPDAIKMLTGVDVTEKSMMSPAKAEKAGVPKEFVTGLVERRFLGQKIVKRDHNEAGNKIFGATQPKREGTNV